MIKFNERIWISINWIRKKLEFREYIVRDKNNKTQIKELKCLFLIWNQFKILCFASMRQ